MNDEETTFEIPLRAMPRGVQLAILAAAPKPKERWWKRWTPSARARRRH